jgi:hypothetical protein
MNQHHMLLFADHNVTICQLYVSICQLCAICPQVISALFSSLARNTMLILPQRISYTLLLLFLTLKEKCVEVLDHHK